MRVPTVTVVNNFDGDPLVINESDYDPARHTLWDERETKVEAPTDPAERLAAIKGAIAQLDPDNPEHFTKGGKPQVEAIEAVLGYGVSAAERDAAIE